MFRFRSLKLKAIRPLFICLIFLFIFNLVIATVLEEHADALYVGAAPSGEQKIIILDAGHGGEDCGAIGIDGVLEKDLNLAITFELGRMLGEKNFAVIYTRTEDKLLYRPDQDIKGIRKISDLKNRCEIAKKYPEALFISIHMNKFDSAILVVCHLVKRGDINALDMRCFTEEAGAGVGSVVLHIVVEVAYFKQNLLTLTDVDKVKELCYGLGVICTGASTDNDGSVLISILCPKGDSGKADHLKCGGIAQLILKRKSDHIELCKLVATLDSGERNVILLHFFLHICPRSIYALAPYILILIDNVI